MYLRIILSLAAFNGDLLNVLVKLFNGDLNGDLSGDRKLLGDLNTGLVGVLGGDRLDSFEGGGRVGVSLSLRLTGVSLPSTQGIRRIGEKALPPNSAIANCKLQLLGTI